MIFPSFYFLYTQSINAEKPFDFDETSFTNKVFWVADYELELKIEKFYLPELIEFVESNKSFLCIE